jgi:hypothetical protein
MTGRLIQKIQRQSMFWAKPAPMSGPVTVPMAHMAEIMENHWPRTARGTRSVTTTSVRAMRPPPPTPWMVRPTMMTVKLFATAATMEPAAKKTEQR